MSIKCVVRLLYTLVKLFPLLFQLVYFLYVQPFGFLFFIEILRVRSNFMMMFVSFNCHNFRFSTVLLQLSWTDNIFVHNIWLYVINNWPCTFELLKLLLSRTLIIFWINLFILLELSLLVFKFLPLQILCYLCRRRTHFSHSLLI